MAQKKAKAEAVKPIESRGLLETQRNIVLLGAAFILVVVLAITLSMVPPAGEPPTEDVLIEFCGDGICSSFEGCDVCPLDCGECPEPEVEEPPPAPPELPPECGDCFVVSRIHPAVDQEYYLDPNDEWIAFKNNCEHDCDITDWEVRNEKNMVFTFPEYVVKAGQEFFLRSGSGTNTETDVYWNRVGEPLLEIWPNPGELVRMLDDEGAVVVSDVYYP